MEYTQWGFCKRLRKANKASSSLSGPREYGFSPIDLSKELLISPIGNHRTYPLVVDGPEMVYSWTLPQDCTQGRIYCIDISFNGLFQIAIYISGISWCIAEGKGMRRFSKDGEVAIRLMLAPRSARAKAFIQTTWKSQDLVFVVQKLSENQFGGNLAHVQESNPRRLSSTAGYGKVALVLGMEHWFFHTWTIGGWDVFGSSV
ncbi:hypothetical protein Tco_0320926 [Tanacetum coccineum]